LAATTVLSFALTFLTVPILIRGYCVLFDIHLAVTELWVFLGYCFIGIIIWIMFYLIILSVVYMLRCLYHHHNRMMLDLESEGIDDFEEEMERVRQISMEMVPAPLYPNQQSGENITIDEVQERTIWVHPDLREQRDIPDEVSTFVILPEIEEDIIIAVKKKTESFGTKPKRCVVCYNAKAEILIMKCRHLCICGDCSKRVTKCPLCRSNIENRLKVFV